MTQFHRFYHQTLLIAIFAILTKEFVTALSDVRVRVPHAVRRGDRATLKCLYNLEDDTLYSVKWYKGRREFYRYTPKEEPPMKVFHFPGLKIKRSLSNESQIVFDSVTMATSGKYSCEVSADAPSFHTLIAAAELEVIETPHSAPFITGIRPRYRVGDILRGNCTSRHSRPAANLTWLVNNEEANPSHVRHYKILREERNEMETAIAGIHFVVTDQHFENGKLKLRCNAQIHDIYWKTTEKTILESDQHSKYGTSGSNAISSADIYDQYSLQEQLTQVQKFFFNLLPLGKEDNSLDDDGDGVGVGDDDETAKWRGSYSSGAATCTTQFSKFAQVRHILAIYVIVWALQQLLPTSSMLLSLLLLHYGSNNSNNSNSSHSNSSSCSNVSSSNTTANECKVFKNAPDLYAAACCLKHASNNNNNKKRQLLLQCTHLT